MCECINIEVGSYDNQVNLIVPNNITIRANNPEQEIKKVIFVDKCIAKEIKDLWSQGIITTGCCCGHNKDTAYIGVKNEFIPKMKSMGYKVHYNPCRPNDEDSFTPKSI